MRLSVLVICGLSLFLSGCVVEYAFKTEPVKFGMVKDFKFSESINIINNQPSNELAIIEEQATLGLGPSSGADLNAVTGLIADVMQKELVQRGAEVKDSSHKVLKLAAKRVVMTHLGPVSDCKIYVEVELGDGFKKVFEEHNVGGIDIMCDMALTKTAVAILNDNDVRAYLGDETSVVQAKENKTFSSSGASAKERLQKLKELLDQGLISQGDYNKKKDAILNEM